MSIREEKIEWYICDRCDHHASKDSPRAVGWLHLSMTLVGLPQAARSKHLCVDCREGFEEFMRVKGDE